MPAFVRTFGKTRQRETVILPTCADGRKLPIIFLFHGKSQLKVIVPAGRPCLVLFTKTAMINGDVLKHILERAVFPNLPRENVVGRSQVSFPGSCRGIAGAEQHAGCQDRASAHQVRSQ